MSKKKSQSTAVSNTEQESAASCAQKHFRIGWWALLLFLTLGIVLESLHGFKVGWFLDVGTEMRRLMWRLAHAHGALLGLVHIAFGSTVLWADAWSSGRRAAASYCLIAGSILLPAGFFLGGLFIYDGDPGLGALLIPPGALALLISVSLTALGAKTRPPKNSSS